MRLRLVDLLVFCGAVFLLSNCLANFMHKLEVIEIVSAVMQF